MFVEIIVPATEEVHDFNSVEAAKKFIDDEDMDWTDYKIRVISPKGFPVVFGGMNAWAEFAEMTGYNRA